METDKALKRYLVASAMVATVLLGGCLSVRTGPAGLEVAADLAESPQMVQRYVRAWAVEPGKMTWNHILTVAAGYGAKEFFDNYDVSVKRRDDKPKPDEVEEGAVELPPNITITLPDGTVVSVPKLR